MPSKPLTLPPHIYYETILRILERETQYQVEADPLTRNQTKQLILTLRKALSQQKQLERSCAQMNIPYEHDQLSMKESADSSP